MVWALSLGEMLDQIPPSLIRRFFEMTAGVKDVVSLAIGEPDLETPRHIKEYAVEGLDKGYTKYGPNRGLPMLRRAVAEKLWRENGIDADPEREVIITVGANMPVLMALASIIRSGEEVLVPTPAFVSYIPQVILAGGRPVQVPSRMEDDYKPRREDLEKYVSRRTRALIINTPSNPTGTVLERRDLEEIADFAVEHDLYIISDEIYEYLVYDGYRHVSMASLNGMFERTITINGFSKAYAMTGWRLGYVAAPEWVIEKMTKIHMYTVTCPVTFIQYAAARALKDPRSREFITEARRIYGERRDYVYKRLREIGLETNKPHGAFYIFPRISRYGLDDMSFSEKLLRTEKVAVVPGRAFGEDWMKHIRISYATSIDRLEIAMNRIEKFVEGL